MRGASGQHGQLTVSGEMLNRAMMLGKLAHEVEFRNIRGEAEFRHEDEPAAVGAEKFIGMLGIFGFRFLFGNQDAVAMGEFHLHVGNAGARRCAGRILNRQVL